MHPIPPALCVGAACSPEKHPELADADADVRAAVEKVRAGARFLITQLIFDNRCLLRLRGAAPEAAGVERAGPCPGIMPITNVDQVERFTSKIGAFDPAVAARRAPRSVATTPNCGDPARCGLGHAAVQRPAAFAVHRACTSSRSNRSPATRAILTALRVARPWARS